MEDVREALGRLCLRHRTSLAKLRNAPMLGKLVHYVSHKLLASDFRVWWQVETGEAKGLWMKVDPRTAGEVWGAEAEQKALAGRLRPGMVFYDAGANIGLFTLMAARLVGETGRVFSFEPEPEIAARLRENSRHNLFSCVTVVEAALYSRTGKIGFGRASKLESPDRGTGRVLDTGTEASGVGVHTIALDDFVTDHPEPDVLKIDVEGAEVEVLQGARKLLQRRRPTVVCELHSAECEAGVLRILEEHGYTVTRVDKNHVFAEAMTKRS
jgi:FkbM family methyltransferase